MTYKEAREYVEKAAKKGSILGLDNIERLMEQLGNPQNQLKVIHIAGTNGKGSTLAYLTNILKNAGYKVGRYISPAVFDYLEIFSINDVNMSEDDYAKYMDRIVSACNDIVGNGFEMPTAFEIETALAYLYFYSEECDVALIETGMGGDSDATNVVQNTIISIISSVSMDHMNFLGNTISEITHHKAGIIKENSVAICAGQNDETAKEIEGVIRQTAVKNHTVFVKVNQPQNIVYGNEETTFDYESIAYENIYENVVCENAGSEVWSQTKNECKGKASERERKTYHLTTKMCGVFQPYNASTAVETAVWLRKKGFHITDNNIISGISCAKWHGRFEKIKNHPAIYFDGGHNPDAAKLLAKSMEIYFTNKKIIYIIGVLADKDYDKILEITAGFAYAIITVTPKNVRALDGEELMLAAKKYHENVSNAENIDAAIKKAVHMSEKDDVIFIFGSLSYLKEAKEVCVKM